MAARKVEAGPEGGGQAGGDADGETRKAGKVAIVKKYANRRLYNTASSSYVTLEELCQMVREGQDFLVYDAKTGDDITRSVLTQIILEEDAKGRNLMPIGFLRQLIGFYDDSLQSVVPRYLEVSMENFARHQEQMRGYMEETVGRFFPMAPRDVVNPFEEVARQNIALFQKAASLFTPTGEKNSDEPEPAAAPAGSGRSPQRDDAELSREMRELKAEMEALQRQMSAMRKAPAGDDD